MAAIVTEMTTGVIAVMIMMMMEIEIEIIVDEMITTATSGGIGL